MLGVVAGLIAYVLYDLIGFFTNLAYYHTISVKFRSPEHTQIGLWVILIPVVGGLIVGLMAKYGSEKIKGHGIPEAMEAVLTSRSRIEAKVAILKPLSAAIAIGTKRRKQKIKTTPFTQLGLLMALGKLALM